MWTRRSALLQAAAPRWAETAGREPRRAASSARPISSRRRCAALIGLAIREAGKSLPNAVAEVREAVDFCRYYAAQIRAEFKNDTHRALGPVVCIGPWNFPLAIFVGRGRRRACRRQPGAGQARRADAADRGACAVRLFHRAGVPRDVLQLLPGAGGTVGAALVADPRVAGVVFTGSTEVAQLINRSAGRQGRRHGADRRDRRAERDDRRQHGTDRAGRGATCWPPPSTVPASAARRCGCFICRRTSPTGRSPCSRAGWTSWPSATRRGSPPISGR